MNLVDEYVVYDDVTYIKQSRINRNNILVNNQPKLINISLKEASPNKKINEIELVHDEIFEKKMLRTLQFNYVKAPYFRSAYDLAERIISNKEANLALFLFDSLKMICEYLKINTRLILSSSIEKDCALKKEQKIYNICEVLHANEYYNSIGGLELYDKNEFEKRKLTLHFLKINEDLKYKQFNDEFVPNLSILDVMMFNSTEKIREMLNEYTLC